MAGPLLVAFLAAHCGPLRGAFPLPPALNSMHSRLLHTIMYLFAGGSRAYIAVAGGFDVPDYLGSKSTFPGGAMGGHQGRALRPGDMLPLGHAGGHLSGGACMGGLHFTALACTLHLPPPYHCTQYLKMFPFAPFHDAELSELHVGAAVPPAWRPLFCSGASDWSVGVLPGELRAHKLADFNAQGGSHYAQPNRARAHTNRPHTMSWHMQVPRPIPTTSPMRTSRCSSLRRTRCTTTRECEPPELEFR